MGPRSVDDVKRGGGGEGKGNEKRKERNEIRKNSVRKDETEEIRKYWNYIEDRTYFNPVFLFSFSCTLFPRLNRDP